MASVPSCSQSGVHATGNVAAGTTDDVSAGVGAICSSSSSRSATTSTAPTGNRGSWYSVAFPVACRLGVTFRIEGDHQLRVYGFQRESEDWMQPAEAVGVIRCGDVLIALNSIDFSCVSIQEQLFLIGMLQHGSEEVGALLHFRRSVDAPSSDRSPGPPAAKKPRREEECDSGCTTSSANKGGTEAVGGIAVPPQGPFEGLFTAPRAAVYAPHLPPVAVSSSSPPASAPTPLSPRPTVSLHNSVASSTATDTGSGTGTGASPHSYLLSSPRTTPHRTIHTINHETLCGTASVRRLPALHSVSSAGGSGNRYARARTRVGDEYQAVVPPLPLLSPGGGSGGGPVHTPVRDQCVWSPKAFERLIDGSDSEDEDEEEGGQSSDALTASVTACHSKTSGARETDTGVECATKTNTIPRATQRAAHVSQSAATIPQATASSVSGLTATLQPQPPPPELAGGVRPRFLRSQVIREGTAVVTPLAASLPPVISALVEGPHDPDALLNSKQGSRRARKRDIRGYLFLPPTPCEALPFADDTTLTLLHCCKYEWETAVARIEQARAAIAAFRVDCANREWEGDHLTPEATSTLAPPLTITGSSSDGCGGASAGATATGTVMASSRSELGGGVMARRSQSEKSTLWQPWRDLLCEVQLQWDSSQYAAFEIAAELHGKNLVAIYETMQEVHSAMTGGTWIRPSTSVQPPSSIGARDTKVVPETATVAIAATTGVGETLPEATSGSSGSHSAAAPIACNIASVSASTFAAAVRRSLEQHLTLTYQDVVAYFFRNWKCSTAYAAWKKRTRHSELFTQLVNLRRALKEYLHRPLPTGSDSDSSLEPLPPFPLQPVAPECIMRGGIEEMDWDIHTSDCPTCDNGGSLLCCNACDKAYHRECICLPTHFTPSSDWLCPACNYIHETPEAKDAAKRRLNHVVDTLRLVEQSTTAKIAEMRRNQAIAAATRLFDRNKNFNLKAVTAIILLATETGTEDATIERPPASAVDDTIWEA